MNIDYLTKLLSHDWGFYYTVTRNLARVKESLLANRKITETERTTAARRIDTIVDGIDRAPKSTGWKMRAKVGPSKKWYKDVEEVVR